MSAIAILPTPARRIELTPAQTLALDAMREFATGQGAGMFTLEGYAGVGKSTVVAELLRTLPEHRRIAVAAPTNKAVGVLQDKIGSDVPRGVEFGSLHSFLGLRLIERQDGTLDCRPDGKCRINDFDLVIVDEASMVGRDLFARLSLAQHSGRTLFVGDPAQLPPVTGRGQPRETSSAAFTRVQRKVALTEVVRQQRDNPIIALSMMIRAAIESGRRLDITDLAAACPSGAQTLCFTLGGTAAAIEWALYDLREGRDSRILAYRNSTVVAANQAIHSALHGNEHPFAIGERVMANDAFDLGNGQRLYNSEEATVAAVLHDAHPGYPDIDARRLTLKRADGATAEAWVVANPHALRSRVDALWREFHRLKAANDAGAAAASATAWTLTKAFAPMRHVYAMTVHKSQGSSLRTVIVDLGDVARMPDPVEHARALYVAVTRPTQNLGLVAP